MSKPPGEEFPRVTWSEVRDHLKERLMMDAEWTVEGPDRLEWWPSPLPMAIEVIDSGDFPNSNENWLRVIGTTLIAKTNDRRGRKLANEHAHEYPVGALVYSEGALSLHTIYSFNPRNRTLLAWFYQALLVQASVAVKLAISWNGLRGVRVKTPAHPSSGMRDDVDELVHIYGKNQLNFPVDMIAMNLLESMRPLLREGILAQGDWRPGFSNGEVDFFNFGFDSDDPSGPLQNGAFDFAIGVMPDTDLSRGLGPSLQIIARLLPPGVALDAKQVISANNALAGLTDVSVFGFISGPEQSDVGSNVWATVPHITLAEWANLGPEKFRDSVLNAVWHVTASAQRFRREILGIEWPSSK